MHGAFALLVALERRAQTGRGCHVECTMVEGALQAASEQSIEYTAYGNVMQREGNRAPYAAPQGLYPCSGHDPGVKDRWLALSVETDAQWEGLKDVLGRPDWADADDLVTHQGRRAGHDRIDDALRPWFAARDRDETIEALLEAGVPASTVVDPRLAHHQPQLVARGFFEEIEHPVVGAQPIPGAPFRYASVKRWLTGPAPLLGQHNEEVLSAWLGLSEDELRRLEAGGVIGTRPEGL
jgi:crotonobetainyl-CoA:carnitine CoA-transferase CaiB-like acyl-CoA transferase